MTCRDCIHNPLCEYAAKDHHALSFIRNSIEKGVPEIMGTMEKCCTFFKDRSRFIEQKHSQWIENTFGYVCPVCEELDAVKHDYCPNCGTKMDLEDEADNE